MKRLDNYSSKSIYNVLRRNEPEKQKKISGYVCVKFYTLIQNSLLNYGKLKYIFNYFMDGVKKLIVS